MAKPSRRDFLKQSLAISTALTLGTKNTLQAGPKNILSEDRMGVLVDTTLCVGCRRCEYACKEAHDLPTADLETYADRSVFDTMRRPDADNLGEEVKDLKIGNAAVTFYQDEIEKSVIYFKPLNVKTESSPIMSQHNGHFWGKLEKLDNKSVEKIINNFFKHI